MKLFILFVFLFSCHSYASREIRTDDLVGTWLDDNDFNTLGDNQSFGIIIDTNGDAQLIGYPYEVTCPKAEFKNIDGIFHFRCFARKDFEIARLVLAGWRNEDKQLLFGFNYWYGDFDHVMGRADVEDPSNRAIYGGVPVSLVKQ